LTGVFGETRGFGLIVCPEPNERKGRDRWRDFGFDMGKLLLHSEHPRKQFSKFIWQAVRAVHGYPLNTNSGEELEHEGLIRRIAFMDLKNTGGENTSDPAVVEKATRDRKQEIINQITSTINPTHIAVAGKTALASLYGPHSPQRCGWQKRIQNPAPFLSHDSSGILQRGEKGIKKPVRSLPAASHTCAKGLVS